MTAATAPGTCAACRAPLAKAARFCGACGAAADPTHGPALGPTAGLERDLIGREVGGRYRVLGKIGEGGMGAVFRAEQLSLKRVVALKVLRPELSAEPALVRRFNAEAELAARLAHPNTVTLFDFGQDAGGALFIAMEYLEGRSLRQLLYDGGALPIGRTLSIAEQVAASLADAHGHGIVHRDLKPDNVMLVRRGKSDDVVRVLDFGIAKLRDEGGVTQMPMTQAGDMLGTPQYMAPEQIRGEHVDARTDVYALGAMLYEMVTGQLPFEGATLTAILAKHLTEIPLPPSRRRPDLIVPPALDALIMAALAKAAAARPPTMETLADQLAEVQRGFPRGAPGSLPPPAAAPPGYGPSPAASAAPAASSPVQLAMASPLAQGYPISPPPGVPWGERAPQPQGALPYGSPPPHGAPPMVHAAAAPTPVPIGRSEVRSHRSAWLWLLAAVIGGGGLGALIWWGQHDGPSEPSTAAAPAMQPDAAPTAPGDFHPASTDFSITPSRSIYGQ